MARTLDRMMKCALIVVSLLLGSILLPSLAMSEGLQDTKAKTRTAVAQFRTPDATDPCVQTDVDIFVSEGRINGDLGQSSGIATLIEIHHYNHCAAIPLLGISVRPTDVVFRGGDGLASATLTGITSGTDFVTGQSFVLAFAVFWEASGEPTRDRSHEIVTADGCSAHVRFNGSVRPAVAWGSVSIPRVNFTPTTTDIATLSYERAGVQTIGC